MKYNEIISILQEQIGFKPTQSNIASILGVGQSAIGNRVSNKSDFSHEELRKIEMFYGIGGLTKDFWKELLFSLPYYPHDLCCYDEEEKDFIFSENVEELCLPPFNFFGFDKKESYFVFNSNTDSMNPAIYKNDKLIVRDCRDENIKDDEIYIFEYKKEIFIRRLVKNIDEIIIKADNQDPIYKVKYAKKEDIKIVGQVISSIRTF